MQNYVPMIMQFPPTKSYFEKHDWYHTFKRPMELEEDDVKVEGMNVFPYKWKEGKDEIVVWIDRESRGITGFENDELKVYAKLDKHDVLAGMTWKITWTILNKTDREMSCTLKASPPKGVSLRSTEKKFEVPAGESRSVSSSLKVSLKAREKPWDEKSDSIVTRMRIDGQSFALRTGLRTKQAIEVQTDPEFMSVVPGSKKDVYVNLKSNLKKKTKGRIHFKEEGIRLDKRSAPFAISAEGTTGIPLTLHSDSSETKCYSIKTWTEFGDNRTKEKTLKVRCVGLHGVIADIDEDRIIAENARIRLVARKKGAFIDLHDKTSREPVMPRDPVMRHLNMRVGPPFWPSELARLDFKMRVRNEKGLATATLSTASEEREGLIVTVQAKMSSNNIVKIVPILENKGKKTFSGRIQFFGRRDFDRGRITIPSKYGIIQEEVIEDDFPDWMEDVPKKGYFKETWLHLGDEENGLGWMWDHESSGEIELGGWGAGITLDAPDLKPGEKEELPPLCIIPATTDWRMIRNSWLQLAEGRVELDEKIVPRRVFEVGTDPKPLVFENEAEFQLKLRNLRNKKMDARVRLDFPAHFQANRTRFGVRGLCLDNPFEKTIRLAAEKARPGVYFAKARLWTPLYDDVFELPLVAIGKPGKVSVREAKGKVRVDNGLLSFVVVPSFAGSLISLRKAGVEYILSAHPEPGQLSWFRPWYGGIVPFARKEHWPGKLSEESFTHEKVVRGPWRGVRTRAKATKEEELKGLTVSVEYLTRPKSNVVALVQDFKNTGRSSLYFDGGCMGFFQIGGSRKTSAYFYRSGWRQRKYVKVSAWSPSDNRTIVISNYRKRESICFVSPSRRFGVHLLDMAREGKHIITGTDIWLKPKENRRAIYYIVLSTSPGEAKKYHVFSEYVDEDLRS
jgi:hypothetical protein